MSGISRRGVLAGTVAVTAVTAAPAAFAGQAGELSLKGKSILITGTSSGFGNLGAMHYARLGARVFATMRNVPRPEADALRKLARDENLDLHVIEIDVLSDELVASGVAEAERINGGPLDVLVNNAGIVISGPIEVQGMDATRLAFETNVIGYQRLIRAVLPGMRARKSGLIVNISSQQGRVMMPHFGLYSATKFAVESMSEQLAYELVPYGIDVLIIEPGGYPTDVGQNRAKYTQALATTVEEKHASGYPDQIERMKTPARTGTWPGAPDPMDIPRTIAEVAAMPAGRRPLRLAVHPDNKPQLEINRVSQETQLSWLGQMPGAGDMVKAVYD